MLLAVTGVETATGIVTVNSKEVRRQEDLLMRCRELRYNHYWQLR
jgi:hypothetical protein